MIPNRQNNSNKGETFEPEPLEPAEVLALLGACSARSFYGIRNRAIITLLWRSGLRVSELVSLRPSDISLAQHTIRLRKTKSGKAQTRGFSPQADDALARWLDVRAARAPRGARLFCTLAGTPLSDRYVRGMIHRLGEQARIQKRCHPHGLRHTFAADCERAGLTVTEIARLLGHSNVAVTSRYLMSLTNADAVKALTRARL